MLVSVKDWWGHLGALGLGTLRTWLTVLPQLVTIITVAWTVRRLLVVAAAWAATVNAWVSVVIVSVSFVVTLSGTVLALRTVGDRLGMYEVVPAAEGADHSVSHQLAVTLLPFLGIYAVFGTVQESAQEVVLEGYAITHDVFTDVLSTLDPRTMRDAVIVVVVLAVVYVLRRVVDAAYDRTGTRVLGFGAALLEGFFMLTLILSGTRLIGNVRSWLLDRQYLDWLDAVGSGLAEVAALVRIDLPAVVTAAWRWVVGVGWPQLLDVVVQPVLWLAVAALVYGSGVLSVSDLWRRGEAPTVVANRTGRAARVLTRRLSDATGVRRFLLEVQQTFFGDVDDKYLPTWQSLRLILRTGTTFLGAFVLAYGALLALERLLDRALSLAVGGHLLPVWMLAGPLVNLAVAVVFEPLRLTLLGVAFHRTMATVVEVDHQAAPLPEPAGVPA